MAAGTNSLEERVAKLERLQRDIYVAGAVVGVLTLAFFGVTWNQLTEKARDAALEAVRGTTFQTAEDAARVAKEGAEASASAAAAAKRRAEEIAGDLESKRKESDALNRRFDQIATKVDALSRSQLTTRLTQPDGQFFSRNGESKCGEGLVVVAIQGRDDGALSVKCASILRR